MVGTWRGIQGYGGKCQVDSEASMRWAVKKIRRGEWGAKRSSSAMTAT